MPRFGPRRALTLSETILRASISRPESVSSIKAISGSSRAIWRISARFFSPPEKPSLMERLMKLLSTLSRRIFSCIILRNSPGGMLLRLVALPVGFSPSSRGLLPSRTASSERRRKFATLTPGIDIGYWNARKRRIRARRSGEYSKIFSPLNQISPSVTSYFGLPIMTLASVLLPEPLGPISACTSPFFTTRSTPRRIGLPSILA